MSAAICSWALRYMAALCTVYLRERKRRGIWKPMQQPPVALLGGKDRIDLYISVGSYFSVDLLLVGFKDEGGGRIM